MSPFTITRHPAAEGPPPGWDSLVESSPCGSLFLLSAYVTLDAILKWNPVCYLVRDSGGGILWGALVYERRVRFGLRVALPGVNTPVMGFVPAAGVEPAGLLEAGLAALVKRLRTDYCFCQLPLGWRFPQGELLGRLPGVQRMEAGTTLIEHSAGLDEAALISLCAPNRRWSIRKARKEGIRVSGTAGAEGLADLVRLYQETYRRQGIAAPMTPEELASFCRQAVERGLGELTFALSGDKVAAAALTARDAVYEYYLAGVYEESLKETNALSLLVFQRILEAQRSGRGFDFEGSQVKAIRFFFESFGGRYVSSPVCMLRSGLAGYWLSRKFGWK